MTTTSTYPAALDSLSNPASSTQLDASGDLGHARQHTRANDAIEALQATLGVDPQGSYPSVVARLDGELGDIAAALAAILEPES